MTKLTADHLGRSAYVYIRQSSADQPLHNHESRRRQYGLAARARDLGFADVVVIEASRLARTGRDWHRLVEFCGLVGTLIVDEDGIYEPR